MASSAELRVFAEQIRLETIKEIGHCGSGHIGGAMSIVEVLAVLYGSELRHDPQNPEWRDRDYLILSKGHAGPALYAALALRGYFSLDTLLTLNQNGTSLPSHCDRTKTPGVDMTAGSLGQGLSVATGIALGNRMDHRNNYTYLILGDGELDEGQVWEGVLLAPNLGLNNLIVFVDHNGQQLDGYTKDVCDLGDIAGKFRAFKWNVQEIDGHDIGALSRAIQAAKQHKDGPSAIVLHTIKGNGCIVAEGKVPNHHMAFNEESSAIAIAHAEKLLSMARAALSGGEAER